MLGYNNLLPQLAANPFRFEWKEYGATHKVEIAQQPDYGVGGVLWDCELVLAQYMVMPRNMGRWRDHTAVELGAGCALAALVAWEAGATFSCATDLPVVTRDITAPIANAHCASADRRRRTALAAMPLTWGDERECNAVLSAVAKRGGGGAHANLDFILAADIIYHSDAHAPLLATMKQLASATTTLIFTHRRRFENDVDFLEPLLEAFDVVCATPVAEVMSFPKQNLTIYELRIKSKQ